MAFCGFGQLARSVGGQNAQTAPTAALRPGHGSSAPNSVVPADVPSSDARYPPAESPHAPRRAAAPPEGTQRQIDLLLRLQRIVTDNLELALGGLGGLAPGVWCFDGDSYLGAGSGVGLLDLGFEGSLQDAHADQFEVRALAAHPDHPAAASWPAAAEI